MKIVFSFLSLVFLASCGTEQELTLKQKHEMTTSYRGNCEPGESMATCMSSCTLPSCKNSNTGMDAMLACTAMCETYIADLQFE